MGAHYVICTKCGKRFNRDKVQTIQTGARRYAHLNCPSDEEIVPAEKTDLTKLKDYIYKLYGDKANWALVMKQIKEYQKDYNYTLSGILKSLIWFHEVQGNSPEKSLEKGHGGLGIVPFSYQQAYNYYLSLYLASQNNINKDIKKMTSKTKEITIPPPKIYIQKRLFNFLDEEEETGE